jgi:hypothetical protein
MTGEELAEALRQIGWSAGELRRRLGITERVVRDWLNDRRFPFTSALGSRPGYDMHKARRENFEFYAISVRHWGRRMRDAMAGVLWWLT